MKKSITLILFVIIAFTLPVLISSDTKVILRALNKTDGTHFETLLMPGWLADLKLKKLGISDCTLSFAEENDTGPVINFLVAAYGGKRVSNERIETYIARFTQQGCSINEYGLAGMTPLHAAVLFAQPELVKILLNNNADMTMKIQRKDKRVDGMDPLKFAKFLLKSNDSQALKEIVNILQNQK